MGKYRLSLEGTKILTTDPEKRIGLYAIQYLGRAGAAVASIAARNDSIIPIGFRSKYVKDKICFGEEEYFVCLKDFLKKRSEEFHIICPIDISKMLCVIDADREFNLNCNYLLPSKDSLIIADNKELLIKHARGVGLRCPKTFFRVSPDEIRDLSRSELTYPSIIKFRGDARKSHWNPQERYSIVSSSEALVSEYLRMHAIEEYPIIQEYVYGRGFGYFALFDKRRQLKAQFCHRRIREYPITGGPSSCCESFYDAELVKMGKKLLESLEWKGLAMVEFKYDETRKQYFIIEVNPRYWGSLPLAIYSGVNFPVLHALSALEVDYQPVLNYRLGVKVRFLDKDVKSIIKGIGVETKFRGKVRLFMEIFNPKIKEGLLTIDDIGPVLHGMFRHS